MGGLVLTFFLCLVLPQSLLATTALETALPPATIVPSSGASSCLGTEITFSLAGFDNDANLVVDVPWTLSHDGVLLTDANLSDFLQLGTLGSTLSDWSGSTSLTFSPLVEGCFTVGVEPYIIYSINASQNVLPTTIIVADAPSTPVLSGFDAGPGEEPNGVLLCDGGSTIGAVASNTLGEVPMSLSYTFADDLGTVLFSDGVNDVEGEACDGPSASLSFNSGALGVGRYTFEATASNQCGTVTTSLEVEVVGFPTFSLSSLPICVEEDAEVFSDFDASQYAMSEGTLPAATAIWSNGGTGLGSNTYVTPADGDLFSQEITLTYDLFGEEASCSNTAEIPQVVHTPESIDLVVSGGINDNLVCEGSTLILTLDNVSNADPVETFAWTTNVPPSSTSAETLTWESFELDVMGSITQTSVWADGTSCTNALNFEVGVNPMPEITWFDNDATVCANADAGLILQNTTENGASIDVTWTLPDGSNGLLENVASAPTPLLLTGDNFPLAGQFVVSALPMDDFGCVGNAIEGLVEVVANPTAQASFPETCEGQSVTPLGVPSGAQFSYDWTLNNLPFNGVGAASASPQFEAVSCGDQVGLVLNETFTVDGESLTCSSALLTSGLEVVATPQPEVTTLSTLCQGTDVLFELTENNAGAGCNTSTTSYLWALDNDNVISNATGTTPVTLSNVSGSTVSVTIEALSEGLGGSSCPATETFVFDLLVNPEFDALPTNWVLCEEGSLAVEATLLSNPNGGNLTYTLTNADAPNAFDIDQPSTTSPAATLSVANGTTASAGNVTWSVVDGAGCTAEVTASVDIWDLPNAVGTAWSEDALCSGQVLTLTVDDISTDPSATLPASYSWTVTGSNGEVYPTSSVGILSDEVSGLDLADMPFDPGFNPVLLDLVLDIDDGTCQNQQSWVDVVALYPNPSVTLTSDNDVCVGTNWQGTLEGASDISWNGNLATYTATNASGSAISWEVPWEEINITTTNTTPVSFPLTVTSNFMDVQCMSMFDLNLDVLENPEVNLNNVNVPTSLCVGSDVLVSGSLTQGTGQGQPYSFDWSNGDTPGAFNLGSAPGLTAATLSVDAGGDIPAAGSVVFTITDGQGCFDSEAFPITILELPEIGSVTVTPEAACSGSAVNIELSEVTVDDGLDAEDLQFTWSASVAGQPAAVTGTGLSIAVTPEIDEVAFQDFVAPELLNLSLTATIEGCASTAEWNALTAVYPLPLREADNNNVCTGQAWEANITGCEVLTVYGEAPNPDITWTLDDPAAGVDIVLPQSYMQAPTGQTQQTFDFYAGVTYQDAGLTCFNEKPFGLFRRQAPNFEVTGEDNSGPVNDLVLCEGQVVTLNSFINQNGASEAFSWAQYETDSDGNLVLTPLSNNTSTALFIDVEPVAPFDQPTLVEGVAYVTYTYNQAPGFECVVEDPWSFQVLPTPTVAWNVTQSHVCDGDDNNIGVSLVEGATSLNGEGLTWEWDWSSSTFDNTLTTSEPSDEVMVEAQYEFTLDGMFEQNMMVTVTDSYGCISDPSSASFMALERAEVDLERVFVCADDTLEVLASGGDVYTWNVDLGTLDGALEPAVYFPNYVATGDSLQTLVLYNPTHGDIVEVTGALVYAVDESISVTCAASEDINLVVFDMPVLDVSFVADPAPYCEGDVVSFEDLNTDGGSVVYDYWTSTGLDDMQVSNTTTSFALQSPSTVFEVTKYESNAIQGIQTICSVMATETFEVIPNPVISLDGTAGICQDGTGSVVCEVSDADSDFLYAPTWTASSNADTTMVNLGPTSFALDVMSTEGITPESQSNLVFSVYVKDDNGCTSETMSLDMQVLATPILDITDPLLESHCSPAEDCMQVALLNDDLTGVDVVYFWDNEPGSANNGICVNFLNPTNCPFADSTKVTVRYEHTLLNGETVFCQSTAIDSTIVNPTPQPSFSLEAPQACLDVDDLNCVPVVHDTSAYNLCSDDSLSFEWFVTPLGELIQNNLVTEGLNSPFPSICVDTAGVLNLVLEITNSYGCDQTTSNVPFTVHGLPVPELTFEQPSICLPTTVSILNSSSGASNFSMSIPGYPIYENFLSPLVLDVEFPGYYNAEFTVSNTHVIDEHELTCSVETEYVSAFEGRTPPVAEFVVLPDTIIDFVNPVVEFVNLSEGQTENIWSFGNGEGSSELDPEVEYEAAGFYNAQLLVKNEYGCTDVYSQEIEVFTDLYIYVPTAFTPNNDGLNDAWLPSIIGQDIIADYECSVFTRSGDRVFYTTDPNKAWVGGNDLSGEGAHFSSGGEVFAWRISIKKKDGQGAKTYTGQVTMVR